MGAFEAVPLVAEHQRTRRHQPAAERGVVLKAAGRHHRDRVVSVPFFVGVIVWTARTDDVGDAPVVAARDDAPHRLAGRPVPPPARQRVFQFDSSFRQDPFLR